MEKKEDNVSVTHLMRREIQAPIVSTLINGFAEEFGKEKTYSLAKEIICKDAVLSGKSLAEKYSGNTLNQLLKIVENVWAEDGSMEITNLRLSENCLKFDVTKCGYSEMYEQSGVKEMRSLLSCCRDFAFLNGFNNALKLVRTKTIMAGDEICDFCYTMRF